MASRRPRKALEIRPYQLLCILCRAQKLPAHLRPFLRAVRRDPLRPVRLRCNVDSVYGFQNPGRGADTPEGALFNDLRDLTVLQRLGLAPGATLPARDLFARVLHSIPTAQGLCGSSKAASDAWRGCPRAASGAYEKGVARGLDALLPWTTPAQRAATKRRTVREMRAAPALRIRPHHLMCMACFHAGRSHLAPIVEDNLFEAVEIVQKNPEKPVTLVAGCCMICPPCALYDPKSGLCVGGNGMALRDQKKDLDVLRLLGLEYGATLPARELFRRLFAKVRTSTQICGYCDGVARGPDWSVCRSPKGSPEYAKGRAAGLGIPGLKKPRLSRAASK